MATYPDEVHPDDAVVLGLNGQVDQSTGLDYIARGVNANSTPPYEVQFNRRLLRQNRILSLIRQGAVVEDGPLRFGVYPISYRLGGADKSFDGAADQAVADDATTFVWIDSSNALQTGASLPANPTTYLPLARIDTAGGVMTVVDLRSRMLFSV